MNIPTEPIGSIPRPLRLLEAITADLAEDDLNRLYEEAIRDTIERFKATGSPVTPPRVIPHLQKSERASRVPSWQQRSSGAANGGRG